jgi:manganese/iron transport system ATP-binding protein
MSGIVSRIRQQGGRLERGVRHEPTAPTLEVRDVSVTFATGPNSLVTNGQGRNGRSAALKDISFRVEAGQRLAVVGPNGAGKSTLFKLVVGTIKPSQGSINVYGRLPDQHICIAYVPQRSHIDWSFPVTVEDVVMMGRIGQIGLFHWPRGRDWKYVRASLERVNASHLAHKQIGELSGGQQQRVFIARALAQQADLLLMDEPFAGLDIPSHESILEILDSLQADGVTILVATHDLNMAAERFDRVMLLNRQIIAYGQPPEVLTPANLVQAYGGHIHVLDPDSQSLLVADTCCDHDDPDQVAGSG